MAVGVLICAVDVLVGAIQLPALRTVVSSVARRKTTNNPSFLRTCTVPTWRSNPSFTPPTRGVLGGTDKGSSTSLRTPTTDRYCVSPGLVHRRLRRLECLDDLKSVAPIRQWALSCFDAVCEVLTL